tara:strand:- start:45 stop:251 length:207 start_codon:yes stop_codon:yes gene_type:complete
MNKDKLENELASAVMIVLMKHITTGNHENGQGVYLDCKVDFRYLKNEGAILVEELNFNSKVSEFNKKP